MANVALDDLPAPVSLDSLPAPPKEPGILQSLGRAAALGGRSIFEGAANLAALPSDALFSTINLIHHYRGEPMPYKLASQSIHDALTSAGLPEPQNATERFTSGIEQALGGAGGSIGVGRALAAQVIPGVANTTTQKVGEALAASPGAQATGAITGTTAGQVVGAMGAPVPVQIAANMIGGLAGGAAGSMGAAAARGAPGLIEPLTEAGRRAIAGRVLRTAATDPEAAAANLENASQIVPGSAPTTGQAAKDVGLAYFEQRLRGLGDARFNTRASQQNTARQALLDSVAEGGTAPAIQMRMAHRETVTAPLREQAFAEASGKRAPVENVIADIDAQLANPDNAGRSVQTALKDIRQQLVGPEKTMTAPDGSQVTTSQPLTDVRSIYAVRKEINRILEGKYVGADESVLRYAGGQLSQIRNSIDEAIGQVAPSWQTYLTKYAQLSKPIERAQTVQDIRGSTAVAAPDLVTGRDVLSQAKWKNVVDRAMPDLQKTMTLGQIAKLRMVTSDLDRGAAAAAAGKVPGSDTASNLAAGGQISVANIVGRALGKTPKELSPALGTASRPLSWLYKLPDDSIRSLLVDAMLDPKLASHLLKEGTIENVQKFSDALQESSRAATAGAASASAAQGAP